MIEILEFLKSLPLLSEPWFLPVVVGLVLVEVAAIVAIRCITPSWMRRPASKGSNTGTREIRRPRNDR